MSVNNVSPQTFLGGTWQAWGAGKVPVGVDPNDTDFNASNKSGGSKTVTLTLTQIPKHRHLSAHINNDVKGYNGGNNWQTLLTNGANNTSGWGNYTAYSGGGEAHSNMQPYVTCYMWRRTS